MHTSDQLDLRGFRDMPSGRSERITARLLITSYALASPAATDALLDDLTNPEVQWLHIDGLTPGDMREWASLLSGLWDDAADHLRALAWSTEQQQQDRADARYVGGEFR